MRQVHVGRLGPFGAFRADALNATLVQYGLGQDWENAYAAVKLPDALSGIRKALQAAFWRDVRAVAPTDERLFRDTGYIDNGIENFAGG